MAYLRDNYFNNPNYIRQNAAHDPLSACSGRSGFKRQSQWTQILAEAGEDVDFQHAVVRKERRRRERRRRVRLDLRGREPQQPSVRTSRISINLRAPTLGTAGGVAYPGFNDYYQEGGIGNGRSRSIFLTTTAKRSTDVLNLVKPATAPSIDYLCSWPRSTTSAKARCSSRPSKPASTICTNSRFSRGRRTRQPNNRLMNPICNWYTNCTLARTKYAGNASIQAMLNQVSDSLTSMQISTAESLLAQASPAGDYNADGQVTINDYNTWRAAFGASKIIYGSGADGNYDGIVNAADFVIWRNSFAASGNGFGGSIPEPPRASAYFRRRAISLLVRSPRGYHQ